MIFRRIIGVSLLGFGLLVSRFAWTTTAQEDAAGSIQVGIIVQGANGKPETFCVTLENHHLKRFHGRDDLPDRR
jgi:hypothetical protein